MGKKIIVVGGVAGGASVAARVRRLDEDAEITMFEKGPDVSFSNCALPYHLSGTIENADDIVLMSPEQFKKQYNINAVTNTEVIDVSAENRTVQIRDLVTKSIKTYNYDELFLSPGAVPKMPSDIKGIDNDNVFSVRNVVDIRKIQGYIEENDVQNITVVGAGFIGLEVTENLIKAGKDVTLVGSSKHVLRNMDDDLAQIIHKQLMEHGVRLLLNHKVVEFTDDEVIFDSGENVPTEMVIMAVGVKPEVSLAKKIGVKIGETGAIAVNQNYQTNLPHVYAVGDAIEVVNMLTRKKERLDLAFPAQIEARDAVNHAYGRLVHQHGVIGSQVIGVFGLNAASTGLSEEQCQKNGIEYRVAMVAPKDKVSLMPDVHPIFLKLVFSYPTGEILGAQAVGLSQVDKQIDVIATMITMHGYVEDLQNLELCYQPMFSTAKNAVNMAGLVATNILNDEYKQISLTKVRDLVDDGAFIIDAREPDEFAEGHIKGALNIPLSQFRGRLDEIPRNKPVYIHCLTSQRSYNMVRALNNLGYTNIYNIVGSFSGLSEYEYFRDIHNDREPIVTGYKLDL
ncbi:NADH oxidase [Companilactobacillus tucceti DSM 20183]|uniref:NADH oxidase n=1 Tax=Companilactobacillus tucceti DSM 20183 TaxID=1423811 RepID=A0A0R1JBS2_9LACO|nr:FAD-dependent oxidoreductase [Companilactobacillus tucceti]KRK65154.1 NADH oxidase [Companilactobacillus tucceti DSM 20183]